MAYYDNNQQYTQQYNQPPKDQGHQQKGKNGNGEGKGYLEEVFATKSGRFERGVDKVKLIANRDKLAAVKSGRAKVLILLNDDADRVNAALPYLPMLATESEWTHFMGSMEYVGTTESELWNVRGFNIEDPDAVVNQMTNQMNKMNQNLTAAMNAQTQALTKLAETMSKVGDKNARAMKSRAEAEVEIDEDDEDEIPPTPTREMFPSTPVPKKRSCRGSAKKPTEPAGRGRPTGRGRGTNRIQR